MLQKVGSRKAAVYLRPIQPIQQLNSLLNSGNVELDEPEGVYSTKNNFLFSDAEVISDHPTHAKDDHLAKPQNEGDHRPQKLAEQSSQSFCNTRTTESRNAEPEAVSAVDHFAPNDHLPEAGNFVELGDQKAGNVGGEDVSTIQQQFNSHSTVELAAIKQAIACTIAVACGQWFGSVARNIWRSLK